MTNKKPQIFSMKHLSFSLLLLSLISCNTEPKPAIKISRPVKVESELRAPTKREIILESERRNRARKSLNKMFTGKSQVSDSSKK